MHKISSLLAIPLLAMTLTVAAAPAYASATQHTVAPAAVNFVGKYTFTFKTGGITATCPVTMRANHTAFCQTSNQTAKWSQSGSKITIVFTKPSITQTFKGTKTAAGINSKAHPGTFSDNHGGKGTWWAVAKK